MRAERALLNRCGFDLEMSEAQEWLGIGRRLRPAYLWLRWSPTALFGRDRKLDRTFCMYRPTRFAEHVDKSAQRHRHLPVPRIVEEQPLERG